MAKRKFSGNSRRGSSKTVKILAALVLLLALALAVVLIAGRYGKFSPEKSGGFLPPEIDGEHVEIHFIDIGQGDAVAIRFPDESVFIIDAGSGANAKAPKKVKDEYDDYLKKTLHLTDNAEIEYLLVTHPHTDHFNLLSDIFDKYRISNTFFNDCDVASKSYKNFVAAAKGEENSVLNAVTDRKIFSPIEKQNCKINIYAPGFAFAENPNNMSIFCLLEYGGRKVLFTGDAEEKEEEWFMQQLVSPCDIDVLKVGHHGSDTSSSEEFLDFLTPEYAVISCDDGSAYGHPAAAVMNRLYYRGIATYRTNRHGDTVLFLDYDGDFVFRPEKKAEVENNSKNRNPYGSIRDTESENLKQADAA